MSELFHEYETVVIVRPDLDDAETIAIIEKLEAIVTDRDGHLLLRDDWGKRKLAYNIQNHQKGHYVLLNHLSPASLVAELERNIRNEDRVVRFMSVLMDRDVDVPDRLEKAAETRAQRAAEAAARAEAEAKAQAEAEARAAELEAMGGPEGYPREDPAQAAAPAAAETPVEAPASADE
ncbi:MAG: 30S ribosomal protein S6 [Myxococcota bacterium]